MTFLLFQGAAAPPSGPGILDPQGQQLLDPQGAVITEPGGGAPVEANIAVSSSVSVTTSSTVSVAVAVDGALGVTSTSAVSPTITVVTAVSITSASTGNPTVQVTSTIEMLSGAVPTIAAQVVSGIRVASVLAGSVATAVTDTFGVTTTTAGTHHVVVSSVQQIGSTVAGTGVGFIAVSSAVDVTTVPLFSIGALPAPYGGLRSRLVRDSLSLVLQDALGELGWFDADRAHQPLHFVTKPIPYDEPIEPNLVALFVGRSENETVEIGSTLRAHRSTAVIDIFAESESFGEHLWGDIRDLLRGRLGSLQRPTFTILDLRMATPVGLGYAEITKVDAGRQWGQSERMWERRWFRVEATVEDTYFGEPVDV